MAATSYCPHCDYSFEGSHCPLCDAIGYSGSSLADSTHENICPVCGHAKTGRVCPNCGANRASRSRHWRTGDRGGARPERLQAGSSSPDDHSDAAANDSSLASQPPPGFEAEKRRIAARWLEEREAWKGSLPIEWNHRHCGALPSLPSAEPVQTREPTRDWINGIWWHEQRRLLIYINLSRQIYRSWHPNRKVALASKVTAREKGSPLVVCLTCDNKKITASPQTSGLVLMQTQGQEYGFLYIYGTTAMRVCPRCAQKLELSDLSCLFCGYRFIVSVRPSSLPTEVELAHL